MAQTDSVPLPESQGNMHCIHYPSMTQSPLTGQWTSPPSQSREISPESVAPSWLSGDELTCLDQVLVVLINSRKQNTRHTYLQKWEIFHLVPKQTNIGKPGPTSIDPGVPTIVKEIRTGCKLDQGPPRGNNCLSPTGRRDLSNRPPNYKEIHNEPTKHVPGHPWTHSGMGL